MIDSIGIQSPQHDGECAVVVTDPTGDAVMRVRGECVPEKPLCCIYAQFHGIENRYYEIVANAPQDAVGDHLASAFPVERDDRGRNLKCGDFTAEVIPHGAHFPETPKRMAIGMPVFWEPVSGSGERLCILVATRMLDDQQGDDNWAVDRVLTDAQIEALMPVAAQGGARDLIRACQSCLSEHLQYGHTLIAWDGPISGVFKGSATNAAVDSLSMMQRTLIRNHSMIGAITH